MYYITEILTGIVVGEFTKVAMVFVFLQPLVIMHIHVHVLMLCRNFDLIPIKIEF